MFSLTLPLLSWLACSPPPPTSTDPADSPTPEDTDETGDSADTGDPQDTALPAFDTGDPALAQLLENPSFEDGEASWLRYGEGDYAGVGGDSVDGARAMRLSGAPFALLYQRAPISAGQRVQAGAWARSDSGTGNATLKLEFHDGSGQKLASEEWALSAPVTWASFQVAATAPEGAAEVGLALVGSGEGAHWDSAWLSPDDRAWLSMDLGQTQQVYGGLGTRVWGYGSDNTLLTRALDALEIQVIRIAPESATDAELQALHALTEARGVRWILHPWSAPSPMVQDGMLRDVAAFAAWTVQELQRLEALGIVPVYIELMNEPDSGGAWSTGITVADFAQLSAAVREGLDAAGLQKVGILGPGGSALDYFHSNRDYLLALDPEDLAGWSAHAWDDGSFCSGGPCLSRAYRDYGDVLKEVDPSAAKPVFVSEYATKELDFDGQIWPSPEDTVGLNATDSYGYGVRVVQNTLALVNAGAQIPVLWYAVDEPRITTKQWGLLAEDGREKPGYTALAGLNLPVKGLVMRPPETEDRGWIAAGIIGSEETVLVFSNDGDQPQSPVLRLRGLASRPELSALRFEAVRLGSVTSGTAGVGHWVPVEIGQRYGQGVLELELSLPPQTVVRVALR